VRKIVFWLNAILVLPFGIAALIAPAFVFSNFGMTMDAVASGIARGYAATALGYSLIFLMLRNTTTRETVVALLFGSLVFNTVELLVQIPLFLQGLANAMIWTTIIGHALTAVLSALALREETATPD
jgi:hypothetical protein